MTVPAREVIDAHTSLYEAMRHPPDALVKFFDDLMARGDDLIDQQAGVPDRVLGAWKYLTGPARTGRELIDLAAGPLYAAPTYQVAGEIVQAVTGMYRATAERGIRIAARDLPSPSGFAYLDEPVSLIDYGGNPVRNRALSWGPQLLAADPDRPERGVRITSWCDPADRTAFHAVGHGLSPGGLGLAHSVFIPFGKGLIDPTDTEGDDVVRWLHCLWLFMDTEVVISARQEADRPSRRRAERSGRKRTDVTVILLRRGRSEHEASHRDIDWSCCWVVQGHARHLEDYRPAFEHHRARTEREGGPCLVCGARTTHIRAYIKGPEGKPLKTTDVLYRVSR